MATGTDPLQRDQIAVTARDTGARYEAPTDNAALRLARSLSDIQPALQQTLGNIADQKQKDAQSQARIDALETSGAKFADAVRLGQIKPTQNPWYMDAYEREAAAVRSGDDFSQLQTASSQWAEKNDPQAFATRWHQEVANLAKNYDYSPEAAKGFLAVEGQTSQQVLATNQAQNSARIIGERAQNVSALAADQIQRTVQEQGGHISGSQASLALEPVKQRWIATGGSLDDWNKLVVGAVTTASYSIRSPGLIDLLKDPALTNGPRENDTSSYGDGVDDQTPHLPQPLQPVDPLAPLPAGQAQQPKAPLVSTVSGQRLQPPVLGRITNTFAQHSARGSAGVDIAAPIGTSLTTPVAGVAHVGEDPRSGLFVKITSPDGRLVQVMAHLSLAQVQNGQVVPAGMVIGKSGQSGDATGPHVHWQLKVDGKQVDPINYHVDDHLAATAQQQQAAVDAGTQAPELAPAPPLQTITHSSPDLGPSLYDMSGVADAAESDRYRISQANSYAARDKLQAIVDDRKLQGMQATDRLYSTFGTSLLTGNVPGDTIIKTLSQAGYSPPVIAEAINNVRGAVGDSAELSSARLRLSSEDPAQAKTLFDLATEGRTKGYSPDYEDRVGKQVLSGNLSATEGASMVGEAVSRSSSVVAQGRAQQAFDAAHGGTPGQTIKKASDINRGIDTYVSVAVTHAQGMFPGQTLAPGTSKILKTNTREFVLSYLADHPGDWAGAEQQARDYTARFLLALQARKGAATTTARPSAPAAAGSNPRR